MASVDRRPYRADVSGPVGGGLRAARAGDANGLLPVQRRRTGCPSTARATRSITCFARWSSSNPRLTVLAPDYNSGNEILAMRAAGATIHYCPVDRHMQLRSGRRSSGCARCTTRTCSTSSTTSAGRSRCRRSSISAAAAACCSSRTARSRSSARLRRAAARHRSATGRSSASTRRCRCRTARCSCRTDRGSSRSSGCGCAHAGSASVLGRTAELLVQRIRGRANGVGAALQVVKRGMGRAAGALDVRRANVGDIGFNLDEVDLAMSRRVGAAARAAGLRRHPAAPRRELPAARRAARPRRRRRCSASCPTASARSSSRSSCPTSTPRPRALQQRGVDALEFWNESMESGDEMGPDARFLRAHVLELPIHQD